MNGDNCTVYADNDWCNSNPEFFLGRADWTPNGLETGLNCYECGCSTTPTSLYDVPVPTVAPTHGCVIDDPATQYCFTLPQSHDYFDMYYDGYDYVGEWMDDIDAGDTVRFSKICTDEWYLPGKYNVDFHTGERFGCEDFVDSCNYFSVDWAILMSNPTDNGLITILNCPQCGCTLGSNDAITMYERAAGERSSGRDAIHDHKSFLKALKKKKSKTNKAK